MDLVSHALKRTVHGDMRRTGAIGIFRRERSARFARHAGLASAMMLAVALHWTTAALATQTTRAAFSDRSFVKGMLSEADEQRALAHLASARTIGTVGSSAARETEIEWSSLGSRLLPLAREVGISQSGGVPTKSARLERLSQMSPVAFKAAFFHDAQRANADALIAMRTVAGSHDHNIQQFIAFARPFVSRFKILLANDAAAAPTTLSVRKRVSHGTLAPSREVITRP